MSNSIIAYVGKTPDGGYDPVHSKKSLRPEDVEISDDMFIVKEPIDAEPRLVSIMVEPEQIADRTKCLFSLQGNGV